jgi:hypothetical protein
MIQTKSRPSSTASPLRMLKGFGLPLWRRHRIELGGLIALMIVGRVADYEASAKALVLGQAILFGLLASVSYLTMGVAWLVFIARVANGDSEASISNAKSSRSAYPGFMMTLPASDGWMAFVPMLFAVASMTVLFGLFGILHTPAFSPLAVVGWGVYVTSLTVSLQAVAWSRVPGRYTKAIAAGALLFGAIFLASYLQYYRLGFSLIPEVYACIGIVAMMFVVPGFARARHGYADVRFRTAATRRSSSNTRIKDLPRFRSGVETLTWMCWRRQGLVLPAIALATCLLYISPQFLYPHGGSHFMPGGVSADFAEGTLGSMNLLVKPAFVLLFLLGMAFMTGATPRKSDFYRADLRLQPFLSTRPQSGADYINVLVRTSAMSSFLTALIVGWTMGVLCFVGHLRTDELGFGLDQDFFSAAPGPIATANLCFATLFLVIWNAQTFLMAPDLVGRRLASYVPVLLLGAFLILTINSSWPGHFNWLSEIVQGILWTLVALKLCAVAAFGLALVRRKLLSQWTLAASFSGWAIVSLVLGAGYATAFPKTGDFDFFAPCFMVVTPIARFFAAPFALEINRHR